MVVMAFTILLFIIPHGTHSKIVSQLVGTDPSPSTLRQFKILIRLKDRRDPDVSHRCKDRHDLYNIQIVMKFSEKGGLKRLFAYNLSTTHSPPENSRHNQKCRKKMSNVRVIRNVNVRLIFTKLSKITTFDS